MIDILHEHIYKNLRNHGHGRVICMGSWRNHSSTVCTGSCRIHITHNCPTLLPYALRDPALEQPAVDVAHKNPKLADQTQSQVQRSRHRVEHVRWVGLGGGCRGV